MNELWHYLISWLAVVSTHFVDLLVIGVLVLLVSAALAPVGTLRWWAGWGRRVPSRDPGTFTMLGTTVPRGGVEPDHYLVYLSGIADVSGDARTPLEVALLDALAARMPTLAIVPDIFAFSVVEGGLAEQPHSGPFWGWLHQQRTQRTRITRLGVLIKLRNVLQVAVSADRRYGPIYNAGIAGKIVLGLLRQGYQLGSGQPVTLLGYSGGAQVVLGAARYLQETLEAPIQIISLGGVLSNDPGLEYVDHLYHLYGERDRIHLLGAVLFPGRWRVSVGSRWNRARAAGKITQIDLGPMRHERISSYFDGTARLADGRSYLDHTVETTCRLIHSQCDG